MKVNHYELKKKVNNYEHKLICLSHKWNRKYTNKVTRWKVNRSLAKKIRHTSFKKNLSTRRWCVFCFFFLENAFNVLSVQNINIFSYIMFNKRNLISPSWCTDARYCHIWQVDNWIRHIGWNIKNCCWGFFSETHAQLTRDSARKVTMCRSN